MNSAELLRRLHREKLEWKSYGNGAEVSWFRQGVERALTIAHDLIKEEKKRNAIRRPRIRHWLAVDLFCHVRQALNYLERSERGRAIETLQKAIDIAQKQKGSH